MRERTSDRVRPAPGRRVPGVGCGPARPSVFPVLGGSAGALEEARTGRAGPFTDPDRDHAGREQQDVTALDGGRARLVGAPHTGEPRVMGIDQIGQRRLADARPQRQGAASAACRL